MPAEPKDNQLSMASFHDMIEELERRGVSAVLCHVSARGDDEVRGTNWTGGLVAAIGLIEASRIQLRRQPIDSPEAVE